LTTSRIAQREELIFLLNEATELEHSLCCSYLFTALSLKSAPEDGLTDSQAEAAGRWKAALNKIAVDEMMHLAVVNDLLVAVGAAPNYDRPNFPHGCSYSMPNLNIELRGFSPETLRHFIAVEQPAGGDMPMHVNPHVQRAVEGDLDNEIGFDPYALASQGDIYEFVLDGLRDMASRIGEANVFIGPPPSPPLDGFLKRHGFEPVRDLATAERSLALVVEQGEGGFGDSLDSHFHRFSSILDEYEGLRRDDPGFEPAFPVLDNPFTRTPPEYSGPVNIFDDEFAVQVSDLFDAAYGFMLQLLPRFFVTTEETDGEATALLRAAVQLMRGVIEPLGEVLVRQPAGPAHPGLNAGPSFAVKTVHALPYKQAAWIVLRERVQELRDYTERLAASHGEEARLPLVADGLQAVTQTLTAV
jgi:ferritin-like protein